MSEVDKTSKEEPLFGLIYTFLLVILHFVMYFIFLIFRSKLPLLLVQFFLIGLGFKLTYFESYSFIFSLVEIDIVTGFWLLFYDDIFSYASTWVLIKSIGIPLHVGSFRKANVVFHRVPISC